MAYFANSSEGSCFDEECMNCILGDKACRGPPVVSHIGIILIKDIVDRKDDE